MRQTLERFGHPFVDDVSADVDTGKTSASGEVDVWNAVVPALERKEASAIGELNLCYLIESAIQLRHVLEA